MKIVSTTENYLVNGVQLSIGVPLDIDPSYLAEFLALPGVVEVNPELPTKSKKAAPPTESITEKE